jgi:hypothetical protein
LHLLEHRALSQADPLKGKFRSFLLACFQNYLSVEAQRAHARKRGGQCQVVSLDLENAENRYRLEPADHLTKSATADQLQIQEQSFGESKTTPDYRSVSVFLKLTGSLQNVIKWLVELQQPEGFQAVTSL